MTVHVKPSGRCTWPWAVLLIWYLPPRFSSLVAEHKCIFSSFVAMPLSCWDITWYSSQWAGVCLFLLHRPPQHRSIFNYISYSLIQRAKLRMLQEGRCELALSRGTETHRWIESKAQNERRAFGCHGAWRASHLLIPKAAAALEDVLWEQVIPMPLGRRRHWVYCTYKNLRAEFSCTIGSAHRNSDV